MKSFRFNALFVLFLLFSQMLFGQYYFGRNKIQYNQFEWQILKTKHFDIYYYPQMEELAEIGAHWAETCYMDMQDQFNHTIMRRIPLIFYSSHFHFEETNTYPYLIPEGLGGFFEFIKGRVVVPSDGSVFRFKHTIRHELVHVFQRSYAAQIIRAHRVSRYAAIPLWFTEGLAEYWSEGWDSEAEMIIRDGILNQSLVPIHKLYYIQGTYLMYKQGQAILNYIAETYGEDKILRLMDNIWKVSTFSDVLKITLGVDAEELNEEWMYHLKKKHFPFLKTQDFPRMRSVRVTEKGFNTQPAFYAGDSLAQVVFVANRDGYSSIYFKELTDYHDSDPELLIRGERSARWETLHLQRNRIDVNQVGILAFIAKSGPQDLLNLYSIPEDTVVRQWAFPELVSVFSPSWSPDGKQIAIAGLDASGKRDLYLVDVSDGSLKRLTNDYYDDMDPDWSPDGSQLVFTSDRGTYGQEGFTNLFLMVLNDGQIEYLTSGPFVEHNPAWSPDGQSIVFSSDRGGVPNLWLINPDVSRNIPMNGSVFFPDSLGMPPFYLRQVTHFSSGAFTPCWTDSSRLVFTAFENFSFQIRYLDDAPEMIAQAETLRPDTEIGLRAPWQFEQISGEMKVEKVRYKRKFSLDFAQSQVVQDPIYGTSGGGQISISDLLGNEMYYLLLYNNARTRSEFWEGFNLAATRVDMSRRVNYSIGLYRLAGLYFNYYEGFFRERRYGGFASISYPFNKFQRIETSFNIRHSEKEWYGRETFRKAMLVSNFISFTHDNSLWGPTGPLDGSRYKITMGNTVDILHSNVNFTTMIIDLRQYFRVGLRMCHAVRVWGQFNRGQEPLPFFMGGSWDLRGYKLWSLWGPNLVLISNEFRFPFLDQFYLGFPFGGVGFSSIRGALFVDAGNVWEDQFGDMKGSFGFGIRFRLGGYLVLRYDMGKRTDFLSIEKRTFHQFFFGWDF